MRQRFVEEGLESALNPRPRTYSPKKLDGETEAHLVAVACSEAPEGSRLRLLADKMVSLTSAKDNAQSIFGVEKIPSDQQIRNILDLIRAK